MLKIEDLHTGYGAITILRGVSLDFPEKQLTTIVGPNGAGKTTLLRAITGLLPYQGTVEINGKNVAGKKTWDFVGVKLAMVPEGRMIFPDMTVEENLALGAFDKRCRATFSSKAEEMYVLFPKLKERRLQLAGSLSGGEAQMLAMARALMSDPEILLIDEPSLGLSPVMVKEVFNIIGRMKEHGVTIVLVEQNTRMAIAIADLVYLMRDGKILLKQPAADVDLHALHELYLAQE